MSWLVPWLLVALAGPIELVLHDPVDRTRPADSCDARVCGALLERIEAATSTLDLALYGMRDQTALLSAIARARARGVKVRLVVDRDLEGNNLYRSTAALIGVVGGSVDDWEVDRATARRPTIAEEDRVNRCEAPPGFDGPPQCLAFDLGDQCLVGVHATRESLSFQGDIMHHKFAVIDGRVVWTGSTNTSDTCSGGYNANTVVVIDDPRVAAWYTAEFEQLWAGRFHHQKLPDGVRKEVTLSDGTRVRALFSPQDDPMDRAVRPALRKATRSIDIAVFFLTHKGIAADLIAAHRRGVAVRVILDATAAGNGYTKHEVLRAAGIPVKVEDWGGKMHAKSALIDGETILVGSMNWTSAGEDGNDENTLVIQDNPTLATQYAAWFETMWLRIPDRWLHDRPDPESRDSGTACSDGSDNDYDGKTDQEDPGCSEFPPPLPALPPMQLVPKVGDRCVPPGAED